MKRYLGLLWVASLALSMVVAMFGLSQPVQAAGETYTWSGYNEIVVNGGDLDQTAVFKQAPISDPNMPTTVEMQLNGSMVVKDGSQTCVFSASLLVYKDGKVLFWKPEPYPPGVGGSGRSCTAENPDLVRAYHNKWLTVGGDRGANPNRPETEGERRFHFWLDSSKPQSTAPASTTVTIKQGNQTIAQLTAPAKDDSGAANYPPDQTPISYEGEFLLNEGDYQICDTAVIPECKPFTKEKYKPLNLRFGTRLEMPHEKQIIVKVITPFERPCGSSFTANPIVVEIIGPDGAKQTKETEVQVSEPNPDETNKICKVKGEVASSVTFDNIAPGQWKACVAGNQCQEKTKVAGERLEFEIRSEPEVGLPSNQPVCTTGSGLAGALAWILCPLTVLIVSATGFIEQNIILPYLSVSPLTTDANNPVYIGWQGLRNIANIFFVIVLLLAILSVGFSRYGLKRLIPRVFVVAIGVNISYFVIAFIIDSFNVLGAGVGQLVMSVIQTGGAGDDNVGPTTAQFWTIGGAALLLLIVKAGPVIGWLFGFLAAAFLVILVTVLVLVFRQLLILALTLTSPLWILAWLLRGTEDITFKSAQLLWQLLLMYPFIVLLFAIGKILGALLGSPNYTLVGENVAASQDLAEVIRVFFQFLGSALPLILLPTGFFISGAVMKRVRTTLDAFTQDMARRAAQGVKNSKAGQFVGEKMQNRRVRLATTPANTRGINAINPLAWKRRAGQAVRASDAFNKATGGFGTYLDRDNERARRDMESRVKRNLSGDLPAAFALADAGGSRRKLASIIRSGRTSDGTLLDTASRQRLQGMLNDGTYNGAMVAKAVGETLAVTNQITAGSYEGLTKMANADGVQARDDFIADQNKLNDKNGFSNLSQAAWGQRADGTMGFKQFAPEYGLKSASQMYSGLRLRDTKKEVLRDDAVVQQIRAQASSAQGRTQIMREAAHMTANDQLAHLAGAMHGWVMRPGANGQPERDLQATLSQQVFQDDLQAARDELARGK